MNSKPLTLNYQNPKTKHKFVLPIELFKKPKNNKEYAQAEKILDKLIDEVRGDETHVLAPVMQIIGDNLEEYDNKHYPKIGHDINDIDMVRYLMEIHDLHQKNLAHIFGSQPNVSKFLNGERRLSKKQIMGLKKQFGISADFFL